MIQKCVTSVSSKTSFLIKNRFGVFYFQKRVPQTYLNRSPRLPKLVRLSLGTKSIKVAIKLARLISVMWDLRAKQYFKDEQAFHEAMKLFQEYLKAESKYSDFEELSKNFLDNLDDETGNDSKLLSNICNYYDSLTIGKGVNPYVKEIERLRNFIGESQSFSKNSNITSSTLDSAFEEFISHNKTSWKGSSTMENTFRVSYYPVFKSVVRDKKTSDITKSDINEFIKLVLNLPANKTKIPKYQKKTFLDFLTMTVPEKDRLSPTTQEKYIRSIGSFLKWLKRNDYSEIDLDAPLKNVKFSKTRSNEQRNSYTKSDLKKMFNSDQYIQGGHKQQSHFWVPLIGLYTGARLNEICQLQVKDVYLDRETKRWVFDINEDKKSDPNKSLKKPFHARLVPVHKKLIELGFIDYLDSQKKQKRLFSDLPFVSSNNKYGDKLQRWFNRTYLKNCQITTTNTSFHSLRHTVITHLVNDKGIDPNRIAVGFGQTPVGGVTQTVYTKRQDASQYFQYFDLIDFSDSFDIKKIRDWKSHLFNRK